MKKLLYIDTETTGLVAGHHAIIQLAYIIEINGKVAKRGSYKINPKTYSSKIYVSPKALECNGYRVEDFDRFTDSKDACKDFMKVLSKYKEGPKFKLVAFNSHFDIGFIQAWMKDSKQDFYGRFIDYKDLDVFALVKYLQFYSKIDTGISQNLENSCKAVGLEFDAHDAVGDIEATRDLHLRLVEMLQC